MPKVESARMQPRTAPGQSFTIPQARVLSFDAEEDGNHLIVVTIDEVEAALIEAAAAEVVKATFPRKRAKTVLPLGDRNGVRCLYSTGQFPPVIRDADNKPLKALTPGMTVNFRVMLKAIGSGDRIEVCAYPSRLDVLRRADSATDLAGCAAQSAVFLEPPGLGEPAIMPKRIRATRQKSVAPAFDKAAFARHRAEVVKVRARLKAARDAEILPPHVIPLPQRAKTR